MLPLPYTCPSQDNLTQVVGHTKNIIEEEELTCPPYSKWNDRSKIDFISVKDLANILSCILFIYIYICQQALVVVDNIQNKAPKSFCKSLAIYFYFFCTTGQIRWKRVAKHGLHNITFRTLYNLCSLYILVAHIYHVINFVIYIIDITIMLILHAPNYKKVIGAIIKIIFLIFLFPL